MFTTALRNEKQYGQILQKSTSPYFHSVSLVIWPLSKEPILASYPFQGLLPTWEGISYCTSYQPNLHASQEVLWG